MIIFYDNTDSDGIEELSLHKEWGRIEDGCVTKDNSSTIEIPAHQGETFPEFIEREDNHPFDGFDDPLYVLYKFQSGDVIAKIPSVDGSEVYGKGDYEQIKAKGQLGEIEEEIFNQYLSPEEVLEHGWPPGPIKRYEYPDRYRKVAFYTRQGQIREYFKEGVWDTESQTVIEDYTEENQFTSFIYGEMNYHPMDNVVSLMKLYRTRRVALPIDDETGELVGDPSKIYRNIDG